jgi:ketosteroid isomerase-like protein
VGLSPHRQHRSTTQEEESTMSKENADLVRRAYQAYASGDLAGMLESVDPDLEWTWAEHGLRAELEEVVGSGELVMVAVRTPGGDAHHSRSGDDRAYSVVTVREGRVVALRDCCDRQEALRLAGIQS